MKISKKNLHEDGENSQHELELSRLRIRFISCDEPKFDEVELYESAYKLWKKVWTVGVYELYGKKTLFSDSFMKQHYFGGIFRGTDCLALCCYRKVDLRNPVHAEDSWFEPWPSELVKQFAAETPVCVVPSWLSVDPEYRRANGYAIHLGRIIMELLNYVCIRENAQASFGVSRNDRSVDKILDHIGGVPPVSENIKYKDFSVSLYKFNQKDLLEKFEAFPQEIHFLINRSNHDFFNNKEKESQDERYLRNYAI